MKFTSVFSDLYKGIRAAHARRVVQYIQYQHDMMKRARAISMTTRPQIQRWACIFRRVFALKHPHQSGTLGKWFTVPNTFFLIAQLRV